MKLCECGCGYPAPISKRNRRQMGIAKGQPFRFIHGHNSNPDNLPHPKGENSPTWKGGKIKRVGYTAINITPRVYKMEHIIIAEQALGKPLPPGAVVHHVNKKRSDNRKPNLVICENNAYHLHLHKRERRLRREGVI